MDRDDILGYAERMLAAVTRDWVLWRTDPPPVGGVFRSKSGWETTVHAVDGTTVTVDTPPGSDSGPTQTMAVWYFWVVFTPSSPPMP